MVKLLGKGTAAKKPQAEATEPRPEPVNFYEVVRLASPGTLEAMAEAEGDVD